jgi:hypothetical protein
VRGEWSGVLFCSCSGVVEGELPVSEFRRLFSTMSIRQNTVVCCFDANGPRLSALRIHRWIAECMKLPVDIVRMIQVDG